MRIFNRLTMGLLVMLVLLMGKVSSVDALEIGEQVMDVTISNAITSEYIWRGWDLFGDDPAWQPSVDITFPELFWGIDLSLNGWGSFPLDGGAVAGTEADYSVSLSKAITDYISVGTGYTYFDFWKINSGVADVHEFWGSLTVTLPIEWETAISTTFWGGYDFPEEGTGPENGWYLSWSVDLETPLPNWAIFQEDQSLAYGVVMWSSDGVAGTDPAYFYAYDFYVTTTYAINDYLSVSPAVYYTMNNEDSINRDDEFWAIASIDFAF